MFLKDFIICLVRTFRDDKVHLAISKIFGSPELRQQVSKVFSVLFLFNDLRDNTAAIELCNFHPGVNNWIVLDEILEVSVETHIDKLRQGQRSLQLSEQLLHQLHFSQ